MAPPSALMGQPPANHHDYLIIRGTTLVYSQYYGKVIPEKGLKSLPRPPPDQYKVESNANRIMAVGIVCMLLVIMSTGARVAIRMMYSKLRLGWDDWVMVMATIFAVANFSVYFHSIKIGGMGKHMYDVTYEEYANFYAYHIPRNLLWWLSLGAVKVSIALFYMRLQGFTSRRWMIVHWSLFVFTVLLTAVAFFIILFSTLPVRAGFDRAWAGANLSSPDEVRQIEAQKIILALNGWHIATDILFLIVPVAMLWKVQMRWTIKMRVWIVGFVGVGNIALGLVRTQSNNWLGKDVFYSYIIIAGLSSAEVTLGIITASLPILSGPLVKLWRSSFGGSTVTERDREHRVARHAPVRYQETDEEQGHGHGHQHSWRIPSLFRSNDNTVKTTTERSGGMRTVLTAGSGKSGRSGSGSGSAKSGGSETESASERSLAGKRVVMDDVGLEEKPYVGKFGGVV